MKTRLSGISKFPPLALDAWASITVTGRPRIGKKPFD